MNEEVIINNIPSANRKDFGYRSINSSNMHNVNQQEMLNDILDLFNKANAIERTLTTHLDYIKLENSHLEAINYELMLKYQKLLSETENIKKEDEDDRKYVIYPYDCNTEDTIYGAVINNVTSDITVRPSKKVSKTIIYDTLSDSIYLPNSLNVEVRCTNGGIISKIDNDLYAPFYSDNNLYWTRKVVTDNSTEYIDTEYIITLPEDIQTSAEGNEIYIEPFLATVLNVYTREGDSSDWEAVSGSSNHSAINPSEELSSFVNSARPFRLNFPNKKMNQIKIVLRCNDYKECETNLRAFVFGLKNIGVYINYYDTNEGSDFYFDFELKENRDLLLREIVPHFNNDSDTGNCPKDFLFEIYYKSDDQKYHKIIDSFPCIPQTNKLRIKCKFGELYGYANIKDITIHYSLVKDVPTEADKKSAIVGTFISGTVVVGTSKNEEDK